jgi:membrane-associated phospholipid phosphatase
VVFSFYLYYVIYAILPVAGPQYYFDTIANEPIPPYFFGKIMHHILLNVEQPTGAFPSSHVGLAIILNYIAFKHLKTLFYISLPFVIGICFATVYLKAHYAVDVLAALISAPIFIWISSLVYNRLLLLNTSYKQNA